MNRRTFFKLLGISAATAAVAPKMLAETPTERMRGWVTLPPRKTYKMIFPESVRISDEEWKFFEYLKEQQLKQLGVADLKALQKAKENAHS